LVNMQQAIATARRRRPFTLIGALIALVTLAAFVWVASMGHGGSLVPTSGETISVVVAKAPIQARTKITADDLKLVTMPAQYAPPGSFQKVKDVVGVIPIVDMKEGAPVTSNVVVASADLIPDSSSAFLPIPKGYVAMTIPTGEQQGVAGYIQPGDYIALIAEFAGGNGIVKTALSNVHVIRVGAAGSDGGGAGRAVAQPHIAGPASSLTVIVNECDAEYVNWIIANAGIRYTLESYHDYKPTDTSPPPAECAVDATKGVDAKAIQKRFNLPGVPGGSAGAP